LIAVNVQPVRGGWLLQLDVFREFFAGAKGKRWGERFACSAVALTADVNLRVARQCERWQWLFDR
jgi:hypothetical protein